MKIGKKAKIGIAIIIVLVIGFNVGSYVMLQEKEVSVRYVKKSPTEIEFEEKMVTTVTPTPAPAKKIVERPTYLTISEVQTRMEIFTASMTVEVDDVSSAVNQVMSLAKQLDGYVSGSSISRVNDKEIATITLRVPKDRFYVAINSIGQLGKITNLASRSQDVTEEYIDLKARRDNLLKQEDRLNEILKMAKTVDEVLKVEKELERVRGEIERLTGRINYLENRVELSTITITFVPKTLKEKPIIDWYEPIDVGIKVFYSVIRGLIIVSFALAPFAIIGAPIYYYVAKRRKRKEK